MQRFTVIVFAALTLLPAALIDAAQSFTEGTDYVLLRQAQRTSVPAGKVEVLEVFSYACPACNLWRPVMTQLRGALPGNAQMVYLPASFNAAEDFPMFQRAYLAADTLGIAARTHEGVYAAVWQTGELATSEPNTRQLKKRLPTIEDAARCYARLAGIQPEAFLAVAKSFTVEMRMKAADAQILAMEVPSTPCIVVNGKYRVDIDSVKDGDRLIQVVNYLVAKETH